MCPYTIVYREKGMVQQSKKQKVHDKRVYYSFILSKSYGMWQSNPSVDNKLEFLNVLKKIQERLQLNVEELMKLVMKVEKPQKDDIIILNDMIMDLMEKILSS